MVELDPIDFSSPDPASEPGRVECATKQKASFQIDTRDKAGSERRRHAERRVSIRFEEDRRSHQDRRPQKLGWDSGGAL
jgi:hypothetical protein